jgi:hypothetical protein
MHAHKLPTKKKSATAANFDPGPVPAPLEGIKELGIPGI